jgi:predicted Ser/Thr protein kinase
MEDTVRVADYYYVDYDKATLNLYPGNVTAFDGTPETNN